MPTPFPTHKPTKPIPFPTKPHKHQAAPPDKLAYVRVCLKLGDVFEMLESKRGPKLSDAQREKMDTALLDAMQHGFQGEFSAARGKVEEAIGVLMGKPPTDITQLPPIDADGSLEQVLKGYVGSAGTANLFKRFGKTPPTTVWPKSGTSRETKSAKAGASQLLRDADWETRLETVDLSSRALAWNQYDVTKLDGFLSAQLQAKLDEAAAAFLPTNAIRTQAAFYLDMTQSYLEQYVQTDRQWHDDLVSAKCLDRLNYEPPTGETSYEEAWCAIVMVMIFTSFAIAGALRRGEIPEAEELLASLEKVAMDAQTLSIFLANHIDTTMAAQRKKVEENDLWDLISGCVERATKKKFDDSLDDWHGYKKWCVIAGCTTLFLAQIITAGPAAILPALGNYVYCFMRGMIGSSYGVAYNTSKCILGV